MAWVTAIGPSAVQVEYRLTGRHGCATSDDSLVSAAPAVAAIQELAAARGVEPAALFLSDRQRGIWGRVAGKEASQGDTYRIKASTAEGLLRSVGIEPGAVYSDDLKLAHEAEADPRLAYRMDANERPLMWIGAGLSEFDLTSGAELTPDQWEMARAMMRGVDPRTGEQLVSPKQAVDPRGKLAAQPLVKAVRDLATAAGQTPQGLLKSERKRQAFARMERGVERLGQAHRVRVGDIGKLADALGIDTVALYGKAAMETALKHENARVTVGNQGYDLTLTMPKAFSVLAAFADGPMATELEGIFTASVSQAVQATEKWTAYGMRGHHGDQESASRIESTGLMGWVNFHRTARTVGDAPFGDPHIHAHVSLANICRGTDGEWSTIAAGGRDLYRHASAIDALMQAQIRAVTHERWGIEWKRSDRTEVWEITGIPPETIDLFSKRRNEVRELFAALGLPFEETTTAMQKAAAARIANGKNEEATSTPDAVLRAYWRAEAEAAEQDPDAILGAALRPPHVPPVPTTVPTTPQDATDIEAVARWVFRTDEGLTAHRKSFTRAEALTAVIDAATGGVRDINQAEDLTDRVLAHRGYTVRLDSRLPEHLSNTQRYTTADIIAAERSILHQVRSRTRTGTAVVSEETFAMTVATYEAMERGANPTFSLSDEQLQVLRRVLRDGHGVDAVIGVAGAGKTTIMQVARMAWEAEGHIVRGASTAAVAAANLRMEAGIESDTVAMLLHRLDQGKQPLRGVDALVLDEAAMVDDRQLARVLLHAAETGTKVLGIGDPLQLSSPGVGGSFEAVHTVVGGLTLTHNFRQRDAIERQALEMWRNNERREALRLWADHGHIRAAATRSEAIAAMLTNWQDRRSNYAETHDQIANVLMLASRNADVDELNTAARAIRRELGELGTEEHEYALAGGGSIAFSVGDIVLIRQNDYRARTGSSHNDVLNGFRGRVVEVDAIHGVHVEWREKTAGGGTRTVREWTSGDYIASGGLSHGIAMTVHKAQGLSADHALIYGPGLASTGAYTGLSRDRVSVTLFLPRDILEDPETSTTLGDPQTPAEEIARVLAGFETSMGVYDSNERLIVTELGEVLEPVVSPAPPIEATATEWSLERLPIPERDPRTLRLHAAVEAAGLDAESLAVDPEWETLAEALEASEAEGLDAVEVLRVAVSDGPMAGATSPAAVLAWRILNPNDASPGADVHDAARDDLRTTEETSYSATNPEATAVIQDVTIARQDAADEAYDAVPGSQETAERHKESDRPNWAERTYGRLTDAELAAAIAEATAQARDAQLASAKANSRAEQQTNALADGTGESEAAVEAHAESLRTRAEAVAAITGVETDIEETGIEIISTRAELADLESTTGRRKDRAERAAQAADLRDRLATAERRAIELDIQRNRLEQTAGPAMQRAAVSRQWNAMAEQLPALRATAKRSDEENAQRAVNSASVLGERARQSAAQRDELTAEKTTRTRLTPAVSRAEERQRQAGRTAVSHEQTRHEEAAYDQDQALQHHRDTGEGIGQSL